MWAKVKTPPETDPDTPAEERAPDHGHPSASGGSGTPDEAKSFPFPWDAKIHRKRDFEAAFADGGKAVSEGLVIYARGNQLDRNRLGLVVGKRLGKAVLRNRIKRLLREAFRLENPGLRQGYDLVIIPRGKGFPATTAALIPMFRATVTRAQQRFDHPGDRGPRKPRPAKRGQQKKENNSR
jgi:ribonuclease P protein component